MSRIFWVARREFRTVAGRKMFWIAALLPLLIGAISGGVSAVNIKSAPGTQGYSYLMLDRTGKYQAAVEARMQTDHEAWHLQHLADYLAAHHVSIAAHWGDFPTVIGDREVSAVIAEGGLAHVLPELSRDWPQNLPGYSVTPPWYVPATMPAGLSFDSSEDEFDAAVRPIFDRPNKTAEGDRPLGLAIYIPADDGPPKVWVNGASGSLLATISDAILQERRRLQAAATGTAIADPTLLPMRFEPPPVESGQQAAILRAAPGIVVCYLVFLVTMMTNNMLLQATMEERANRLLESLLACLTPGELLVGKLLGMALVSLLLALLWGGVAGGLIALLPGGAKAALLPSVMAFLQPSTLAWMLFYFVTAYLVLAFPFLLVGAMCDTPQEAQPFQMPLVLCLMPVVMGLSTSLTNPDSSFLRIMSWIPIYTPTAMLARLGQPIPWTEQAGTTLLLLAFLVFEFLVLGRLFRHVLLRSGQPPRWRDLLRMLAELPGI